MAREKIVLVVRDAVNKKKLSFSSWRDAGNHIRMVILGQIIDELANLAMQDDPSEFTREIEELKEIATYINYPRSAEDIKDSVEQWNEYTNHAPGYTTIDFV